MKIDFGSYNSRVKDWGKKSGQDMKAEGQGIGIKHRAYSFSDMASRRQLSASTSPDDSLKKLRVGYKSKDGMVAMISYKFRRSLIYAHYGAGKGRGGQVGSKWTDPKGATRRTRPSSFGKMGTAGRKAKPFISTVLERDSGLDELSFIAADEIGSSIINNFSGK